MILYGHADSHADWAALLGDSPVRLHRGSMSAAGQERAADDLACLLIRPRPGSAIASVGVVGGTGPARLRLASRLPYFRSGVAYPDCVALSAAALAKGDDPVVLAGYFGPMWQILDDGSFAWAGRRD